MTLQRRDFLTATLAASTFAVFHRNADAQAAETAAPKQDLTLPESGRINVAFALSQGANVIDTAGPWEVFQDAAPLIDGKPRRPFQLYTVAKGRETIRMTGGLQVVPEHTFADAPQPQIIVVPAQSGSTDLHEWLRNASKGADLTMSVCTGAIQLGNAGLLDGLKATTHHDFYDQFAKRFPNVELIRERRVVDNGRIATAGGLTSGFDMALHVVTRYFGPEVAKATAEYMEYKGYRAL
jgi:transcriptional regulator GlxA family with amidase domain